MEHFASIVRTLEPKTKEDVIELKAALWALVSRFEHKLPKHEITALINIGFVLKCRAILPFTYKEIC